MIDILIYWSSKFWYRFRVQKLLDIYQSGSSPKVVALFSATNFCSNIIELLQLNDTIQIKWNFA